MRTLVLIAAVGAMGLSAFLWSGTAHAQVGAPQKANPCAELRLEIETGDLGPVASWPQARIMLGLFCAYEGDPNPFVMNTAVAQADFTAPTVAVDHQMPPDGD